MNSSESKEIKLGEQEDLDEVEIEDEIESVEEIKDKKSSEKEEKYLEMVNDHLSGSEYEENLSPSDAAKRASEIAKEEKQGRIEQIGNISEAAAEASLGPNAKNLNDIEENYPTYDVVNEDTIASVKTHDKEDSEANDEAYKKDFYHMLGWGRSDKEGLNPVEQDAKRLKETLSKSETDAELLEDEKNKNDKKLSDFLAHESSLIVPDDHVESIKETIRNDAKELPENYGMSSEPGEEDLDQLTNRIKPMGIFSEELKEDLDQEE